MKLEVEWKKVAKLFTKYYDYPNSEIKKILKNQLIVIHYLYSITIGDKVYDLKYLFYNNVFSQVILLHRLLDKIIIQKYKGEKRIESLHDFEKHIEEILIILLEKITKNKECGKKVLEELNKIISILINILYENKYKKEKDKKNKTELEIKLRDLCNGEEEYKECVKKVLKKIDEIIEIIYKNKKKDKQCIKNVLETLLDKIMGSLYEEKDGNEEYKNQNEDIRKFIKYYKFLRLLKGMKKHRNILARHIIDNFCFFKMYQGEVIISKDRNLLFTDVVEDDKECMEFFSEFYQKNIKIYIENYENFLQENIGKAFFNALYVYVVEKICSFED